MVTKQKTYTSEFKAKVSLEAIKGELTINQITSKYGVHASQINRWKQQAMTSVKQCFTGKQSITHPVNEALIEQLYSQIGQMKVELDFLKKNMMK